MRLCLVEDIAASGLEPLTLTRPVHELLLGATIAGEQARAGVRVGPGPQRRSCMIRSHLVAGAAASRPALRSSMTGTGWLAGR